MRAVLALLDRTIRAVRSALADPRIPRPLRWFAAIGLLPIPGPVDEAVLLVVAVPLLLLYRVPLADAWRQAGRQPDPSHDRHLHTAKKSSLPFRSAAGR